MIRVMKAIFVLAALCSSVMAGEKPALRPKPFSISPEILAKPRPDYSAVMPDFRRPAIAAPREPWISLDALPLLKSHPPSPSRSKKAAEYAIQNFKPTKGTFPFGLISIQGEAVECDGQRVRFVDPSFGPDPFWLPIDKIDIKTCILLGICSPSPSAAPVAPPDFDARWKAESAALHERLRQEWEAEAAHGRLMAAQAADDRAARDRAAAAAAKQQRELIDVANQQQAELQRIADELRQIRRQQEQRARNQRVIIVGPR